MVGDKQTPQDAAVEEMIKTEAQRYAPDGKYEFFRACDFEAGARWGFQAAENGAIVRAGEFMADKYNGLITQLHKETKALQSQLAEKDAEIERLKAENERLFSLNIDRDLEHPCYQLSKELEAKLASREADLKTSVEALEHYTRIADVDGALGRDRRQVAREAIAAIKGEK